MVVGFVRIGGTVVKRFIGLCTVAEVEMGLVTLNSSRNLLGETALRFVFYSDTAVELHVAICFAVCAHGEFASGDASDADVFARRGPAYRAPLGLKVSLAGH